MTLLRIFLPWGRCPQTPGIYRVVARMVSIGTGSARPRAIPAAGSALESHPCVALSSAQVCPGWTTATSPCNNFAANGDYPLNFLSHSKGSLHLSVPRSLAPRHCLGLKLNPCTRVSVMQTESF